MISNKPFLSIAGGVVAVVLSGVAAAQTSGVPSGSSGTPTSSSSSPSGSLSSFEHEAVATQLISTTTLNQMLAISNAISFRAGGVFQVPPGARADSGQRNGMAAGGAAQMWNAWGSISGDTFKYTPINDAKLRTTNAVLGADYALKPTVTVGASVAFDRTTGSLFNTTTTGYTIAPYAGWQINKTWALDGIIGWGKGDIDTGAGSVKPDRFFYGSNLSYTNWLGNLQLSAKGSYLYGEEKVGSAKNKLDQWRIGGRVGYWMDGILPYVGIAHTSDGKVDNRGPNDIGKTAWVGSLGVDFISLKNNLTGGIVYTGEGRRKNSKHDSLMANINYRF